jgi:hypothetical protein
LVNTTPKLVQAIDHGREDLRQGSAQIHMLPYNTRAPRA